MKSSLGKTMTELFKIILTWERPLARHPEAKKKNADKFGYIKNRQLLHGNNHALAYSNDKQLGEIAGAYHRERVNFPLV